MTNKLMTNNRGDPTEFQQIIAEKSHNFVGREVVFTAINDFLHCHSRGYLTIIGAPGSGKSAILAKYAIAHAHVVYYNVGVEGKNRAGEFLSNICTQLVETFHDTSLEKLPDNATEGSWFLSSLLQEISEELEPNQKLIIAIDGLNYIDSNSQPPGTNLFYLPRYLPDGVYFLLTRRPFIREKSGLLIETPSQSLDLADYPAQNRQDIQAYIQKSHLESWLSDRLTDLSENNFMYLSEIMKAIVQGIYTETFPDNPLPPALEAYYQQHLQKMIPAADAELSLAVLNVLVQQQRPITANAIAQIIDTDEYDVAEVLENWFEFLDLQQIDSETHYKLYHDNFRQWLGNNS